MEQYLTLIKQVYTVNDLGQEISTNTETVVIAKSKSVTRLEFSSLMDKFAPEIVFIIKGYEYSGERLVKDEEGNLYDVIRTYRADFEEMELTCQFKK